jgi:homoserine dehydrogenase
MTRKLKIAILGFGNASRAFSKILEAERVNILSDYNTAIVTTGITTGSHGALYNPKGLHLDSIRDYYDANGEFLNPIQMTSMELAESGDYDVLIEATPLNIHTGQPATDHIKTALKRGKAVITANKGPIAWYFKELKTLAKDNNCPFFYETTVMDGTPVFNLVNDTLKMCKVTAVDGILNSTTNFILEELAKGRDYDEVIAEGRELGFIEADSAMDIEGYDAAAKLTALLNVLMDADLTPDKINRKGIEDIDKKDIENASKEGKVIKLICHGDNNEAYVRPTLIDKSDMMATIDSTSSIVQITTNYMGKLSVIEHDPDLVQTGYGIFSDLIRVIESTLVN